MANNKQIYVMFLCDEWKSVDSYRLYMVSTNDKKIKEEVRRLVQKGDVIYTKDFDYYDKDDLQSINNSISNIYIKIVADGETQF